VNRDQFTDDELKKLESCKRKPIPEDMTIEQLKEEMEENEDTVECAGCEELFPKDECVHKEGIGYLCDDCADNVVQCTWCEELYDKSECRYEVDMGWLCDRCEAAIKSRGETLTFREGNYWDFLDEKLDIDFSECVDSSDMEIWGIEPVGENTYKAVFMKKYEGVDFHGFDAVQAVHDEMLEIGGLFVFYFDKHGKPALDSWNPELLNNLGNCEIIFDDERYDQACEKTLNGSAATSTNFDEELESDEMHDLGNEYDGGYPKDNKPELPEIDEVSDAHLKLCPECGKTTFDTETGICVNCGFN
jgi:hypothetical protein